MSNRYPTSTVAVEYRVITEITDTGYVLVATRFIDRDAAIAGALNMACHTNKVAGVVEVKLVVEVTPRVIVPPRVREIY